MNYGGWSLGPFEIADFSLGNPVIAFDSSSLVMPTDAELTRLRQMACEKALKGMIPEYAEEICSAEFIQVPGWNTVLVRKMAGEKGRRYWQYRQVTWRTGPSWMPCSDADGQWKYLTLDQLAHDHILRPVGGYPQEEE